MAALSPAEYLPLAEELADQLRGVQRRDLIGVAADDQLAAAERDLAAGLAGIPTGPGRDWRWAGHTRPGAAGGLAVALAVGAAAVRRKTWWCPHVEPGSGVRAAVDATTGVGFCLACAHLAPPSPDVYPNDGRCDVCDQPAELFTPQLVQLANIVVALHACPSCTAFCATAVAEHGVRPGRNVTCPCGSGIKFKRCCGR